MQPGPAGRKITGPKDEFFTLYYPVICKYDSASNPAFHLTDGLFFQNLSPSNHIAVYYENT